jgi:KUP system potassium uptake protein
MPRHYARSVATLNFRFMKASAPASGPQVSAHGEAHPAGPTLMIAALGVVFGDIGTSPLYAFKETMNPEHGIPFSPDSVLGLLSLIVAIFRFGPYAF